MNCDCLRVPSGSGVDHLQVSTALRVALHGATAGAAVEAAVEAAVLVRWPALQPLSNLF